MHRQRVWRWKSESYCPGFERSETGHKVASTYTVWVAVFRKAWTRLLGASQKFLSRWQVTYGPLLTKGCVPTAIPLRLRTWKSKYTQGRVRHCTGNKFAWEFREPWSICFRAYSHSVPFILFRVHATRCLALLATAQVTRIERKGKGANLATEHKLFNLLHHSYSLSWTRMLLNPAWVQSLNVGLKS